MYRARTAYLDPAKASSYERNRFRGPLGAYKLHREHRAVESALAALPRELRTIDCPTGMGRWVSTLAARGHQVVGVDISPAMLAGARQRSNGMPAVRGEAEHLPIRDGGVDLVFSFALAKHLPGDVLFGVLDEFARVTRVGFVCTINITPPALWGWTKKPAARARAIDLPTLQAWARSRELTLRDFGRCHTPVGMERCLLFDHTG